MLILKKESVKRHIKTHSERSSEDRAAIAALGAFLNPGGRINTAFAANDTWPNHDGTFEFVPDPDVSRRPTQNFFVQIKGTNGYVEKDGIVKYSLKSLAFPAYICDQVSFDPGILFVVFNPEQRGAQRVFWKYMSVDFLNSINFDNDSMTVCFCADDEIMNTDESVAIFCEKLESIIEHHSFVNRLDSRNYSRHDIERIISVSTADISECIERFEVFNDTRDGVSRRILTRLNDLCTAVLLLNTIQAGIENASLPLAWERSMLNIETKYLGTFLKGLQYIGKRVPDEGQSERLMLKYDGKFGLNNINKFFQSANQSTTAVSWYEWTYKIGDRILFNETARFSVLYNNLKGRVVDIGEKTDEIIFTVDVETILTEKDCKREEIDFISVQDNSTRIRFSVYKYDEGKVEEDEELQMKSVIPFQLAYAVSIHKAQGLEYDSVKVIIPRSNAEKISHGVFYTAITRAKKKLKIYWSSETMKEVIGGFYEDETKGKSLEIIKAKLQ